MQRNEQQKKGYTVNFARIQEDNRKIEEPKDYQELCCKNDSEPRLEQLRLDAYYQDILENNVEEALNRNKSSTTDDYSFP